MKRSQVKKLQWCHLIMITSHRYPIANSHDLVSMDTVSLLEADQVLFKCISAQISLCIVKLSSIIRVIKDNDATCNLFVLSHQSLCWSLLTEKKCNNSIHKILNIVYWFRFIITQLLNSLFQCYMTSTLVVFVSRSEQILIKKKLKLFYSPKN